jgi:hypothetical protein
MAQFLPSLLNFDMQHVETGVGSGWVWANLFSAKNIGDSPGILYGGLCWLVSLRYDLFGRICSNCTLVERIVSNGVPHYDENHLTFPSFKRYGAFNVALAWTVQYTLSLRERRI